MKKVVVGLCISVGLFANSFQSGLEKLDLEKDLEAYKTFFTLAKSGDVDSQTMLGEMHLDGIGTNVDVDKAFYWLSKASNSGDPEAQYLLGFMYENGIKVDPNNERAAKLYTKSAQKGDILAKYNLAMMYKDGKGVKQDKVKAYSLLKEIESSKQKLQYQARAY
jgi:TPR repeat protein